MEKVPLWVASGPPAIKCILPTPIPRGSRLHCVLQLRLLSCACMFVLTIWMFSSLRVCHSSSIVGKQQDGAMDSSQTRGNVCAALLRAAEEPGGWCWVGWVCGRGRPPVEQEQHQETR